MPSPTPLRCGHNTLSHNRFPICSPARDKARNNRSGFQSNLTRPKFIFKEFSGLSYQTHHNSRSDPKTWFQVKMPRQHPSHDHISIQTLSHHQYIMFSFSDYISSVRSPVRAILEVLDSWRPALHICSHHMTLRSILSSVSILIFVHTHRR